MKLPGDKNPVLLLSLIIIAASIPFAQNSRAQTYPQDFYYSSVIDAMVDAGYLWENHNIFHPLEISNPEDISRPIQELWLARFISNYGDRVEDVKEGSRDGIGLVGIAGMGVSRQIGPNRDYENTAIQPALYIDLFAHKNVYGRVYSRSTNEPASLPHYTGHERDTERGGQSTAELDQALLGYRNNWFQAEFGRGREIWGPNCNKNLVMGGHIPAFERIQLQFSHAGFRFRSFYGFLETERVDGNKTIQRYIAGRALEYRNKRNFLVGIGEISILAGEDRPIDLAFVNPLAFHLEVDQNYRSNESGATQNNALWFAYMDWYLFNHLRLTTSFILDEYKLDKEGYEKGRDNSLGYSSRLAWNHKMSGMNFTLFGNYVHLDTYTFQHDFIVSEGFSPTNFVNRGYPLGHPMGNDAEKIEGGIRFIFPFPLMIETTLGSFKWGENSILNDPFSPLTTSQKVDFPSGVDSESTYFKLHMFAIPYNGFHFNLSGQHDLNTEGLDSGLENWEISVSYNHYFSWFSGNSK